MKAWKIIVGLLLLSGLSMPVLAEGMHWNKNMVMIYVPQNVDYAPQISRAFREWESRLGRKIQFFQTSNPRDLRLVEVEVQFNQVSGEGAKNTGSTTLQGQTNAFRHGNIVINAVYDEEIEKDPVKKAKNDEEIYRVMLHEVGRVIGLQSSSNPESVMFDKIEAGQTILPEDIDNIYQIYGWPARRN